MIERLIALCKLWNKIKYFHPYLAYKEIDWDAALVEAIPKVQSAENDEDFAQAIQQMLNALDDSTTHVLYEEAAQTGDEHASNDEQPLFSYETHDGILVVTLNEKYGEDWHGSINKLQTLAEKLSEISGVVFDLRTSGDEGVYVLKRSGIFGKLIKASISTPGQRLRLHSGLTWPKTSPSFYYSGFVIMDGERIVPDEQGKDIPVAFIATESDSLPLPAVAFQAAEKGAIFLQGEPNEATLVRSTVLELSTEVKVRVRLSELIYEDGSGGFVPNASFAIDNLIRDRDPVLEAALEWVRHPKPNTAIKTPLPARAVPTLESDYEEMRFPSLGYRLLAAFRIWGAIHYFFPYKNLMGEDWDDVLKQYIQRFTQASDATAYALVVAEMLTHIHDSHVRASSPVLDEYFGTAVPSIRARMIENIPIVTKILDEAISKETGLEVGDIILKVDGEDARTCIDRCTKYISASTPHRLMNDVTIRFLLGPEDSLVTLTVKNQTGSPKEIKLQRKGGFREKILHRERVRDIIKLLPNNIGYADLDRLSVPMVDEMFEKFKETKAIIFDMRGYPKGAGWTIAPRLTSREKVGAAAFQRPLLLQEEDYEGFGSEEPTTQFRFIQALPKSDKWNYSGRTVMLIDERTISAAEHIGLFFKAANGTTFVGSHSAGANGDVSFFSIPGGIRIMFSGHHVNFPDGRQLQRIGLLPDVEASPTIAGIRAGRDEVLEAAIAYLEHELDEAHAEGRSSAC